MAMEVRRVVTGHNEEGRAVVINDGIIEGREVNNGLATFAVMWRSVSHPVDNDDSTDRSAEFTAITQPNGSVLRIVDMRPGARSPMHRTNSLDYGIVIEGHLDLELDDGQTTRVKAGDVIVQRGTMHAWVNKGTSVARVAFILLDAKAATFDGKPLEAVDP